MTKTEQELGGLECSGWDFYKFYQEKSGSREMVFGNADPYLAPNLRTMPSLHICFTLSPDEHQVLDKS